MKLVLIAVIKCHHLAFKRERESQTDGRTDGHREREREREREGKGSEYAEII